MDIYENEINIDEEIEKNLFLKRLKETLPEGHPIKKILDNQNEVKEQLDENLARDIPKDAVVIGWKDLKKLEEDEIIWNTRYS